MAARKLQFFYQGPLELSLGLEKKCNLAIGLPTIWKRKPHRIGRRVCVVLYLTGSKSCVRNIAAIEFNPWREVGGLSYNYLTSERHAEGRISSQLLATEPTVSM